MLKTAVRVVPGIAENDRRDLVLPELRRKVLLEELELLLLALGKFGAPRGCELRYRLLALLRALREDGEHRLVRHFLAGVHREVLGLRDNAADRVYRDHVMFLHGGLHVRHQPIVYFRHSTLLSRS